MLRHMGLDKNLASPCIRHASRKQPTSQRSNSRRVSRVAGRRARFPRLRIEPLEQRTLLSVSPYLLKDINEGSNSSIALPSYTALNDQLTVFWADDGQHGMELWVTDGMPFDKIKVNTRILRDCTPGSGPPSTWYNDAPLHYTARCSHGQELTRIARRYGDRRERKSRQLQSPTLSWDGQDFRNDESRTDYVYSFANWEETGPQQPVVRNSDNRWHGRRHEVDRGSRYEQLWHFWVDRRERGIFFFANSLDGPRICLSALGRLRKRSTPRRTTAN